MKILAVLIGVVLILLSLWEGFETIILPRRVTRRFRLTRLFYRSTWVPWNAAVNLLARPAAREHYLSYYGPLSLLLLFSIWVGGLILGFACLHWATGSTFTTVDNSPVDFWTDLYLSGTTFFTLGLGDVTPRARWPAFSPWWNPASASPSWPLVIGYLPTLNQSFSRREVNITLLDARAGSPPPPPSCCAVMPATTAR